MEFGGASKSFLKVPKIVRLDFTHGAVYLKYVGVTLQAKLLLTMSSPESMKSARAWPCRQIRYRYVTAGDMSVAHPWMYELWLSHKVVSSQ